MKICLYARVSSSDGKQDTENQLVQLRAFAAAQGWEVTGEYVDRASGKNGERPEFKRMFADARMRRFDLILFWALDRLSREGVLQTLRYLEQLTAAGVGWRSYTEQYLDSCGVFKDAVLAILAVVAKQERIRIQERVKAGSAEYRRAYAAGEVGKLRNSRSGKNQPPGRPPRIFDRARLRDLCAAGVSIRKAATECGVSESVARRALPKTAELAGSDPEFTGDLSHR